MPSATYAARWVLPVDGEPIVDGCVVVEDGLIVDVGSRPRGGRGGVDRDFGEAVILPGFVNAHTHLEYTIQRGLFEDLPFFPWIRALTASKALIDDHGWATSARLGALECIRAGITTVGDNTDCGVTPRIADESGLRALVFQEVFGIDDREPTGPVIAALRDKLQAHRRFESVRVRLGVSPHALYTVRPALFAALNADSDLSMLPWSIHIAESPAESELTEFGSGPFSDMFRRRGIDWHTPGMSPTAYAADVGALRPGSLAVHCVHQSPADISAVREHGAAIVHCPKSNGKLGAGIAPLAEWLRCDDLCVALGTDSAASNNTLDMFEEMRLGLLQQRAVCRDVSAVAAQDMIRMATLNGARALGMGETVGSLTPGKRADLIAVRLDSPNTTPPSDPYAALVYSARAGDVAFVLCDGTALYDYGAFVSLDSHRVLADARSVHQEMVNAIAREC
ncbi:MAG: amidohydrolase family protein [Capsulimonadaceae bacterium]